MTTQDHKKIAKSLLHDIEANVSVSSLAKVLSSLPKKDQGKVLSLLKGMLYEKEGIIEASLTSAQKLSDADREALVESIKSKTKASAVELRESIDTSLLGGIKLQIKDSVFDSSLKYKLHQLQTHIANS